MWKGDAVCVLAACVAGGGGGDVAGEVVAEGVRGNIWTIRALKVLKEEKEKRGNICRIVYMYMACGPVSPSHHHHIHNWFQLSKLRI